MSILIMHAVGDASCRQYNISSPDGSFGPVVARKMYWVVIEVVHNIHIHVGLCSKLFKGLECAVLSMVLCTIKNP